MTPASRRFAEMLDAILEGFQVVDHELRYVHVNEAAARHGRTTPSALVGKTMMECYPGIERTEMFGLIRHTLEHGSSHLLENAFTFPDGSVGHFELRIQPVPGGACILSIDVTDRKTAEREQLALEKRLHHAQRMEAVGRLAAGVAHDFNNLLTVMLAQGELALDRPDGPTRTDVEAMLVAVRSAAELTQHLLAYGTRAFLSRDVVDLGEILRGVEVLVRPALGEHIQLDVVTPPGIGRVEADRALIEQVVMNLVLNARDAMPEGGRIRIALDRVELDESDALDRPGSRPGPHAVIVVADTGPGMDAVTRAHVFEPFFTTKALGRGSGLGLATVYGIVKQHGGTVTVRSAPGEGAMFEVYLPLDTSPASAPITDRVGARPTARPTKRERRGDAPVVLVAEDSVLLRKLIGTVLSRAGYETLVATGGQEALELWEARGPSIAMLVTDLMMPGMGGAELIARLRGKRGDLPVICTSGYADANGQSLPPDVVFLEKPFSPTLLLERIDAVLRRV